MVSYSLHGFVERTSLHILLATLSRYSHVPAAMLDYVHKKNSYQAVSYRPLFRIFVCDVTCLPTDNVQHHRYLMVDSTFKTIITKEASPYLPIKLVLSPAEGRVSGG